MKYLIFIVILTMGSYSCQKIWPSPADEIKGNWVIDSIKTYSTPNFTEPFIRKEPINMGYYHFTDDAKLYTYKNESIAGVIHSSYDTFQYQTIYNFLLTQRIVNNQTLIETDSLYTVFHNKNLEIFNLQPNHNGLYEKVFLHE